MFIDTGSRLNEVARLELRDVDLRAETLLVHGKGGRDRRVPVGSATLTALDRYVRTRRRHPHARDAALWLGIRGALTDDGVDRVLRGSPRGRGSRGLTSTGCGTRSRTDGSLPGGRSAG